MNEKSLKMDLLKMQSMINYLPSSVSTSLGDYLGTENVSTDVEEISSSTEAGFYFEEYSKTLETARKLSGTWRTHRFDENPWDEYYRPYKQVEEEKLIDEEIENAGVLTDSVIGSALSYIERSPEDLHHVLCKCVLSDKQLYDISEIRYYHYIQYLDLSWNELITLSPLGQLPFLQFLDVCHNYLGVLLDFKASFYLTFVNFSFNLVDTIPDLTQFWSVTHLNLSHNRITKISGLENLRFLSYLDLSHNQIRKLENLNNLRLQFLILHHNNIAITESDDDCKFKTLPYIRSVDLSHNNLTSLKPFQNAENLESIDVSDNNISSLLELYYLDNLRYLSRLNCFGNPISVMKFYTYVCLTTVKNLMILDKNEITAEQRVQVKKSYEIDPSLPARESRINLVLLQQINQPYIGPHIMPYDQPPPLVIMIVGPSGSMKKRLVRKFCATSNKVTMGISHTTRQKLYNEIDGKDYNFVSKEEFTNKTRKGHFIAVSEFNGNSYGIAHSELQKCIDKVLIFHSDINSALSLRIMGINPKLILAMSRDEATHARWIRNKYYYDTVKHCIIRWAYDPECELSEDDIRKNVEYVLDHIIEKVVEIGINVDMSTENSLQNNEDDNRTSQDRNEIKILGILKWKVWNESEGGSADFKLNEQDLYIQTSKDLSKRVSFFNLPEGTDDACDRLKYRSISQAVVNTENTSKPLLSIISNADLVDGEDSSDFDERSRKSFDSFDLQDEKVDDFVKQVLNIRNELYELHWSNPGLFREFIFTDDFDDCLKKLMLVLNSVLRNYNLEKPQISFDKDTAFKNIINSRLSNLDLQGMSYLKINQKGGQCKC